MGDETENLMEMERALEVDYSEVISGDFIDRNPKSSIKVVQRDSDKLSLTCSETRDDSKAVSNSHDEISFQENRSELLTTSQEVVEQEDEQYIECIYPKCGTLFRRSDKAASIHQKLCSLHYSDLIARAKLLDNIASEGELNGTDFDMPGELDENVDNRSPRDEEPFEAGELIMGESELCKSFSVNKVYSGPRNSTEIGRVLRDAHLHAKKVQMEASCVTMSVQEELQGDLINRISSRSIFFSATWFIDEIECENPTLFGYDVFYGYYSSNKNCGYLCNTMICWESSEEGASSPGAFVALTNYFLVALWRTRCNKPRLDAVVFCFFNRRCYRVFNFIPWMRQKFTNPAVLLPLQTHIEIYRSYQTYLDINRWIYDPSRGLPRDTRNPAVNNPKRNNMKVTKKLNDLTREAWEAATEEVSDEGGVADEKREEIDDENSSTTSSDKLGVAKQLFVSQPSDGNCPNILGELNRKLDRYTVQRKCKALGILPAGKKAGKKTLIKRLWEYYNRNNISIQELFDEGNSEEQSVSASTTPSSLGNDSVRNSLSGGRNSVPVASINKVRPLAARSIVSSKAVDETKIIKDLKDKVKQMTIDHKAEINVLNNEIKRLEREKNAAVTKYSRELNRVKTLKEAVASARLEAKNSERAKEDRPNNNEENSDKNELTPTRSPPGKRMKKNSKAGVSNKAPLLQSDPVPGAKADVNEDLSQKARAVKEEKPPPHRSQCSDGADGSHSYDYSRAYGDTRREPPHREYPPHSYSDASRYPPPPSREEPPHYHSQRSDGADGSHSYEYSRAYGDTRREPPHREYPPHSYSGASRYPTPPSREEPPHYQSQCLGGADGSHSYEYSRAYGDTRREPPHREYPPHLYSGASRYPPPPSREEPPHYQSQCSDGADGSHSYEYSRAYGDTRREPPHREYPPHSYSGASRYPPPPSREEPPHYRSMGSDSGDASNFHDRRPYGDSGRRPFFRHS